jgi:hypothetical protein
MDPLTEAFEERLQEINEYITLLDVLETQARSGPPKIGETVISAQQQKILYSSVYVQLYNLVEATVTWCITAITKAAGDGGKWFPGDLADQIKREWVKARIRDDKDLNDGNRLELVLKLCDHLIDSLPVVNWKMVSLNAGGNWDDREIEDVAKKIGVNVPISGAAYTAAKVKIKDDKNAFQIVKNLRNRLAHGDISFVECGNNVTVSELTDIRDRTVNYLREVIAAFGAYIAAHEYISPAKRPAPVAAAGISP